MSTSSGKTRFRFGLRTLLVAMTAICLLFSLMAQPIVEARKQRRLVHQLEKLGAKLSSRGTVMREPSVGRAILGNFGNEYDRDGLYIVDLSGSTVRDNDLATLTELRYLYHLNLSNTNITDQAMETIAACPHLVELDLSHTQVTDVGIAKLKSLRSLAWLRTEGTAVTYPKLCELDRQLSWANSAEQRAIAEVQAYGAQAHGTRRYFEDVNYLDLMIIQGGEELSGGDLLLGMNRKLDLSRADIVHLAHLNSIRSLNLHDIRIEPGSFVDVPMLPKLQEVTIWHTDISDADLQHLARQTQVEEFTLGNSKTVTDVGIFELTNLQKLKLLKIYDCPLVTPEAVDTLRKQLPECKFNTQTIPGRHAVRVATHASTSDRSRRRFAKSKKRTTKAPRTRSKEASEAKK